MARTALERAKSAFHRKRFADVITLLEPNIIQYRESFQYYFYLGLACLNTGDVGGAGSYFQRARQIRMRDPDLLAAQAALFLRRGDTHQAVEYYLEALEYAPEHRLAKRSLDFIRKHGDAETISALVESGRIERFYPVPANPVSVGAVGLAACVALALLGAVIGWAHLSKNRALAAPRADLSALSLTSGEKSSAVELGGSWRYIMTEQQIVRAFADAQRYFQSWRDNAAQVEINRILYSNASAGIKQKARLLMGYLAVPGFDTIKDRYTYATVLAEPSLYLDCWVVWKGMATNVATTGNTVDFDFLVGYDTRSVLEGVVRVHFDTVLPIDPDRPLELLAKVGTEQGKIVLSGKSIYQSGLPGS